MKRRTVLKRLGAASTASVAATGSAASSPGVRARRRIDVSDVSGQVELSAVVDDPQSAFDLGGRDPSDVRLVVGETQTAVESDDIGCDLGCCCSAGGCPTGCDDCFCSVCGDCIVVA